MSEISKAQLGKDKILQADLGSINKTFLEELFAAYHDKELNVFKEAPFKTTDPIVLTKEEYQWIDGNKIDTTLGMLVFNRYILERLGVIQYIGYWDKPINDKNLELLDYEVNNLILMDKIDTKLIGEYIDSRDRLGFWCAGFLSTSISLGLIRPMEDVNKRKAELFKQYEKELQSQSAVTQIMTSSKIESELMGMVRKNLEHDPGYDLYASGDGNLNNNYKTINVMRGAVFNNSTGRYDIVENSLMNGIGKKDITAFANSVLAAAYPSAVGTADAGYMAKIILALLQSERIDPDPNSDCGTTVTIPFTVTKKSKQYCLYRYIDDNGKKVLTTIENINDYMGKTIRLYSPQCCTNKHSICGKCAGRVFYNLGVRDVGLLTTQITQKLLNIKLKSKHDLSQNAGIIPDNYIFLHQNNHFKVEDGMLINKLKLKLYIPRLLEELDGFVRESTNISCMGIFPVKFFDNNDNCVLATLMVTPAVLNFNVYSDVQEDPDYYIVSYEPGSEICSLGIQKVITNVEFFINQIYLYSKTPQIPYSLMTEMMFRCLEINGIDLTGASITYELLARRVCRDGEYSFARKYGSQPGVDPMSYTKLRFRDAVQQAGVLQGVLFQDISNSMVKGLSQTLNGKTPIDTPLEKIIKA